MLLPHCVHRIQGNPLGLRHEKQHKNGHHCDPSGIEQKSAVLEVAEHGQERLRQHKGGCEAGRNANALPRGSDFHGKNFTWDEPA